MHIRTSIGCQTYKLHRLITIIKPWIEGENSFYLRLTQWKFNKERTDIRWAFSSNDISKPTKNKQTNKRGPTLRNRNSKSFSLKWSRKEELIVQCYKC
jgi:hypothetical protein